MQAHGLPKRNQNKDDEQQILLENGADPNVDINHGYYRDTPLVLATSRGSLGIMRMLIQHKAEVTSHRSDNLSSPLHLMVTNRGK
ncbi:hypothetical protein RRG08_006514 [Elysia crispata]|uniref:Uncharacterized protein n=1 Tax=Elysia crispata TaxID=231223 RepID=A0AAE0YAM3_9GAST|nr:hypothetical protein RRG08_006514 [Elysia crispata]